MAEIKKAAKGETEQKVPRAVLSEGILTIEVDSHVETPEEQEDARWHHLLIWLEPVEHIGVFRVPKNGDVRNKNPPAMRVVQQALIAQSPFQYNRGVQATIKERKGD